MLKHLEEAGWHNGFSDEDLEARLQKLQKAETKLKRLVTGHHDDDDNDEIAGTGSSYPNLKYAKSKYKNVESILKYVDKDEDRGGVKLVIMNFND